MSAPERIIARIRSHLVVAGDCWHWPRATQKGYGVIAWHESGKPARGLTHRLMYEAEVGPIPDGLTLDHMCHDPAVCALPVPNDCPHRRCCNPAHLRIATRAENTMRGGGFAPRNLAKAACPKGHAYTAANTYIAPNGWRQCQQCRRAHVEALRTRRGLPLPRWGVRSMT